MYKQQGSFKRLAAAAAVLTFCALSVSACGGAFLNGGETSDAGDAGREVIKKPDKTITVIDTKPPAPADDGMEASKIDQLKGVRGMDWLSENRILIGKDNPNVKPVSAEGEKRSPINLYIRDLSGAQAQDEPLQETAGNQNFAEVSPDRKHVFYKANSEETARGYIMDLETRKIVPIGKETLQANAGEWADNERVIYPLFKGDIAATDVNGKTETLLHTSSAYVNSVSQRGSKIYYVNREILFVYDPQTKEKNMALAKPVTSFVPSPDGKQFAVVKKISDSEVELTITDAEMNNKFTLGSGSQISSLAWSPDGSKLAYAATSQDDEGVSGMFIADAVSGKTAQISVDMQYGPAYPPRWSPAGDKLMTSSVTLQGSDYVFNTYIISF
ncbi:TolB family protein [Paenibacillus humicola]|uniref:TolB family protein n=1 Tax=Paenibacillus humicola TaxID=3110540 RepID=UPI00237A1390|nr:hypothetical protein [Paenibacillus humicola]